MSFTAYIASCYKHLFFSPILEINCRKPSADTCVGKARAIEMARAHASFTATVEIECENLDMVREAVEAGADIIMFDNMTHDDMAAAIELIAGRAKTECSGNVDASNIRALADLGVDFISSGALTHSAPILDLSLKHLRLLDGK